MTADLVPVARTHGLSSDAGENERESVDLFFPSEVAIADERPQKLLRSTEYL
jgi:hypothetical protein